jgi:hypothetical protein
MMIELGCAPKLSVVLGTDLQDFLHLLCRKTGGDGSRPAGGKEGRRLNGSHEGMGRWNTVMEWMTRFISSGRAGAPLRAEGPASESGLVEQSDNLIIR